jgi:nicotinamidase-related amidase
MVVENIKALIRVAQALNVPIMGTEQEKLGDIVPELRGLLSESSKARKLSFSCYNDPGFMRQFLQLHKKIVILCGIETHICVLQTVLDLIEHSYGVLLVRDATSSHNAMDRETAIERMSLAGAMISTTETVIYELTERAGTEEFRRILDIVKERRNIISSLT